MDRTERRAKLRAMINADKTLFPPQKEAALAALDEIFELADSVHSIASSLERIAVMQERG